MKIFAAMDIGTNSVRLGVVEVQKDYTWTTLASQKQVVRLGEGEFAAPAAKRRKEDDANGHHRLTEEAIARGALVCARFAEVARGFGAEEIVALATAAVREAENGDEFVEKVRAQADLDVRIISGQEEARLIYLGVLSGIELPSGESALIMDIGGGSTELIVGDGQGYSFLDSLRMGAIRLTQEFLGDAAAPVTAAQWAAMTRHVRSALAPASRAIARTRFSVMYGSSGTAQNLAEIAANGGTAPVPTSFRNYSLALADVQAISRRLCSLPLDQRRRVPGINPERGDIILGGVAILQTTMEAVGATSILISDRALREGIVVDRLMRETSPPPLAPPELGTGGAEAEGDHVLAGARLRSIRKLMRATNVDEDHATHIVHLSLALFDQWKALGLHDYGRARELLEYAALLHDAGFFVSHTDHQQHSYYLIRHSELLGFNDREIEIIANLAFYHRKAAPRRRHPQFASLDAKTQRVVRVLSCALRLAEALDRSHLMLVKNVRCERLARPDRVRMTLEASADAQLELWAAQAQAAIFEKTFGLPLEARVAQAGTS
ncbi:MAG: Ppx/GppA family phosphatase [Armatimonadetes bacterium]|nr:Ppx/GppA family phosphatase [Armatimonadota bacterium]